MRKTKIKALSEKQIKRNKVLAGMKPPSDSQCQKCKKIRPLFKHHIKLRSDGGDDKRSNILFLCAECHRKEHSLEGIINRKSNRKAPPDMKRCLSGYTGGLCAFSKATQLGRKE